MARKSPRQIRKIRSVGSILVGGWIRGTRTSFNEKFSVFVASRRRQPTKIIARSMVSPVSCKVHATRNRAAVSESSFPPPFPMHRLFANLLLSPPPHRRRFSPTGPWIIHRIDRPPIVLAPFSRLTILRDNWASLIRFRRRDPREGGEKFKILLILIFQNLFVERNFYQKFLANYRTLKPKILVHLERKFQIPLIISRFYSSNCFPPMKGESTMRIRRRGKFSLLKFSSDRRTILFYDSMEKRFSQISTNRRASCFYKHIQ